MSLILQHTYRFGGFVLDVNERVLMREGRIVPLTPKVFETLLLLVRNHGSIVTKQKILETLWPDVFVEESNVTFNITMLRKALGDTKQHPVYIETVPRRGYRFKTDVREVLGDDVSFETRHLESDFARVPIDRETERPPLSVPENGSAPKTANRNAITSQSQLTVSWRPIALLLLFLTPGLLLIVAFKIWRSAGRGENRETNAQRLIFPGRLAFERLTNYGNVVGTAISPDGKQIVYAEENNGQQSLWLKQLATFVSVRVIPPGRAVYNRISFSHDGNYIYFIQHTEDEPSELFRVSILGGPPVRMVRDVEGSFSLSPDDSKIAFKRRNRAEKQDTLYIADLKSGQERSLMTHRAPDWLWSFSWSPDGRVIIFASGETDSARQTMNISEVGAETGVEKLLLKPNWYFIQQFEWLPDGSGVLICAKEKSQPQIWELSYPGLQLRQLTEDLNYYVSISLAPDVGKMVAVQSTLVSQVWIAPNIDPSKAISIAGGTGKLAWMPDGRIVYDYGINTSSDLWIAKSDGTEPRQLIFNSGSNSWPAISPDGRTIVFQSDRTGAQHLWRMNADGSNHVQLTNGDAERNAAISPDGKWVYYNSSTDASLWRVALEGGEPIKLTDDYSAYPALSPDGKFIASFRFPKFSHQGKITIRNVEDMKPVKEFSLAPGFWISRTIQWDADSGAVVYAVQTEAQVRLYRQSLSGGLPHELANLKAEDEFEFAFSPNGRQLAFTSSKWDHDIVLIDGLKR